MIHKWNPDVEWSPSPRNIYTVGGSRISRARASRVTDWEFHSWLRQTKDIAIIMIIIIVIIIVIVIIVVIHI